MDRVEGKNAIIFGGSGGIGMAINKMLLTNRIKNLLVVDLHDSQKYVNELNSDFPNSKVFFEICDIRSKTNVAEIFRKYFEIFGSIDILVNSAGIVNEHDIDLTFQVNALGPIYTSLEALECMGKHRGGQGGVIVNIASIAGLMNSGIFAIYTSSKHALVAFSESLMQPEISDMSGVKIICICPGATESPMIRTMAEKVTRFKELEPIAMNHINNYPVQSPEKVADTVLMTLEKSESGTWTISNGIAKKFETPSYSDE